MNGCAFCLDMHWKDARASGSPRSGCTCSTRGARARCTASGSVLALELCEAMTVIAERSRAGRVWERAAAVFDHYELGQLVFAITAINAWNRLIIATLPARTHEPGSLDQRAKARRTQAPSVEVGGAVRNRQTPRQPSPSSPSCGRTSAGRLQPPRQPERGRGRRAGGVASARAHRPCEIRNLRAWLTTVVSRLAIDALTSARARRERYVGPWLPEPVIESDRRRQTDPADRVDLDESVSMALLDRARVALAGRAQRVPPARRVRLLVRRGRRDRRAHACRDPAARGAGAARGRGSPAAIPGRARRAARGRRCVPWRRLRTGDSSSLIELLDPAVTFRSDGGGVVNAARTVFTGAERVVRIFTRDDGGTSANASG